MSWFEDHYQPAKARADLRQILQARGVKFTGDKALATWRGEKTPSVHIYPDHWHDFGSGERGDFLDWLELEGVGDQAERWREAARALGIPEPAANGKPGDNRPYPPLKDSRAAPARADPEPEVTSLAAGSRRAERQGSKQDTTWIETLTAQAAAALSRAESDVAKRARRYLEARGLLGVAELLRLGMVDETVSAPGAAKLRGRLLIPTLEGGRAIFYNARALDSEPIKYLKPAKLETPAPFNADALEHAGPLGFVVLTEGELDAASLLAAFGSGYPVMGLPGAAGKLPAGWAEKIRRSGAAAYLLFDNDPPGRAAAEKRQAELSGLGIRAFIASYPAGFKDANEALVGLGPAALAEALEQALEDARAAGVSDLGYIREGWLAEIDARANRPHSAYTTGLEPVDKLLDGGYLEGLHLLGGITGGGKTALALHIAVHNALAGRPVIFGSYEQSRLELWARIASSITGVPYGAIKRGTYERRGQAVLTSGELRASEGWEKLEQAARFLKVVEGGDAFSQSEGSYTVEVLAKTAAAVAEDRGAPPLVIIDYLQRVPAPAAAGLRDVRARVDYVAGQLQVNLARAVGCPVLAVSSINRDGYGQGSLASADLDKRLSAFKESGGLEYTAYTAALLYELPEDKRGPDFSPGLMNTFRPMVLDFVKHREGTPGRFALKWTPRGNAWHSAKDYGPGAL